MLCAVGVRKTGSSVRALKLSLPPTPPTIYFSLGCWLLWSHSSLSPLDPESSGEVKIDATFYRASLKPRSRECSPCTRFERKEREKEKQREKERNKMKRVWVVGREHLPSGKQRRERSTRTPWLLVGSHNNMALLSPLSFLWLSFKHAAEC